MELDLDLEEIAAAGRGLPTGSPKPAREEKAMAKELVVQIIPCSKT